MSYEVNMSSQQFLFGGCSFLMLWQTHSLIVNKLPKEGKGIQSKFIDIKIVGQRFSRNFAEVPCVWCDYCNYRTLMALELPVKIE